MNAIREYLKKKGYNSVSTNFYTMISNWEDWYKCTVDDWHKTTFNNGITNVQREIMQLGMAKTVAETFANLMMNEKVIISTGNESQDKILEEILKDNNFYTNANRLCELYCALGTGAFVEYIDQGEVRIDYIKADMIYPLTWNSRGIEECAFASKIRIKEGDAYYIQMHIKDTNGKYKVENHIIKAEDERNIKEIDLPEGLEPVFKTGSKTPLFQIVKPNIINNYDLTNPMGISVYANAIDVLKEIDTAFDALNVEIETGRRMVFLSSEMFFSDANGNIKNVIGQKETVLRYVGGMKDHLIKDYSPTLRTNDIKETIQFQLNLLSEKCGMGTNQFEFQMRGTKTATEVISEDSDLYQTLKKHEIILEEALRKMIMAISELSQSTTKKLAYKEINITFDDSIIQDKNAERQQYKEEVAMGVMSVEEYRMKVYGETEEEAKKKIPEQANVME